MSLHRCIEKLRATELKKLLLNTWKTLTPWGCQGWLHLPRTRRGSVRWRPLGDVAIEDDSVGVDNLSDEGNHTDASVLALDGPAALEGLGLGVKPSERIEDTKGLGDTKLKLVDVEGRASLGDWGWGKGSSRGDK